MLVDATSPEEDAYAVDARTPDSPLEDEKEVSEA